MDFAGFLSYVIVMTFTPGPNNLMSMVNAGQQGFKRGLRFNIGVLLGFAGILALCAAFDALLSGLIPKIEPFIMAAGGLYILYLAIAVLRDAPHEQRQSKLKLNSVFTGAALQLVNAKVIAYGVVVFSTFILPNYKSIPVLALFVVLLALTGFISTLLWALFGSVLERLFSRHKRAVNAVMALLLLYSAYALLRQPISMLFAR